MVRSDDYDFQLEGACLGHQEDGEVQVKVRNLNANICLNIQSLKVTQARKHLLSPFKLMIYGKTLEIFHILSCKVEKI